MPIISGSRRDVHRIQSAQSTHQPTATGVGLAGGLIAAIAWGQASAEEQAAIILNSETCDTYGTRVESAETCFLDQDLSDTVAIWECNFVLDCQGHAIHPPFDTDGTFYDIGNNLRYYGIVVEPDDDDAGNPSPSGVEVRNCVVHDFWAQIGVRRDWMGDSA